jgi:hypothetical protein
MATTYEYRLLDYESTVPGSNMKNEAFGMTAEVGVSKTC